MAISVDDWVTGRSQPGPYGAGTDGRRTWEARITVGMGGHRSGGGPVAGAPGADRAPAPRRVHPGDMLSVDPQLRTLRNLNTREDYLAALEDAKGSGVI